jgi:hypothetical protein
MCDTWRRQSRIGHWWRAAQNRGDGGTAETAASGNKPISSLSHAGEPLCAYEKSSRGHGILFVIRPPRMLRLSLGWAGQGDTDGRLQGDLPNRRLRELRGVSIHPGK